MPLVSIDDRRVDHHDGNDRILCPERFAQDSLRSSAVLGKRAPLGLTGPEVMGQGPCTLLRLPIPFRSPFETPRIFDLQP